MVNTFSVVRATILWATCLIFETACTSQQQTLSSVNQEANSSFFWGPYRPNLYVGIRPRLPESLLAGLMWANVDTYEDFPDLRHSCEQGDDMGGYGWEEFDARTGGKHIVRDKRMGIDLTTHFVKVGDVERGHWVLRVTGTPRDGTPSNTRTALIFYAGLEGDGELSLGDAFAGTYRTGLPEDGHLQGNVPGLGQFTLTLKTDSMSNIAPIIAHPLSNERDLQRTSFLGLKIPKEVIWQAKEVLLQTLREPLMRLQDLYGKSLPEPALLFSLPNVVAPSSNLYYLQRTFEGPFEFDVIYQSEGEKPPIELSTASSISELIERTSIAFHKRFDTVFPLSKPFESENFRSFGKVLFSNLIGGIGYFHGTSIVDRSYSTSYDEIEESFWQSAASQLESDSGIEEGPTTLFTAVPSRAFFPRGFYWDEGFHLMPIGLWDQDLSLEIIKSWFSLMDEDGWIGREQILGPEARSKVPKEFTTQYPHYANPPTLFIAIDQFLSRLERQRNPDEQYKASFTVEEIAEVYHNFSSSSSSLDSTYLKDSNAAQQLLNSIYPDLKRHYDWFRRTQKGEIKLYDREAFSMVEAYRWRGRTPEHCLTSGIDDYPRAKPPHPGELHLDLHCWMGLMTRLLHNIAEQVGELDDASTLGRIEQGILRNLDDLYWSDEHEAYCDQTIDDYEENVPVCHLGYISIFPVLLGLLPPDHIHLGAVLNLIRNEDHLWSAFGLRSLSKEDPYYGTGENYWRGPIWININYLALASLHKNYVNSPGPHQSLARSIYERLRFNVVSNVEREFARSGIIWEQYNPETGHGQRTKAFTGWTSMVVNIMAEKY